MDILVKLGCYFALGFILVLIIRFIYKVKTHGYGERLDDLLSPMFLWLWGLCLGLALFSGLNGLFEEQIKANTEVTETVESIYGVYIRDAYRNSSPNEDYRTLCYFDKYGNSLSEPLDGVDINNSNDYSLTKREYKVQGWYKIISCDRTEYIFNIPINEVVSN